MIRENTTILHVWDQMECQSYHLNSHQDTKFALRNLFKKVCSEKVSLKHPPSRVHKKATGKPPNGNSQDVNSVVNGIRQTIVSWAKKQDISLTENEHYTIEALQSLLMPGESKASIRCSCNESISIQKQPTGINKWIIGNWSRHLVKQKCYLKKPEGEKQGCLRKFFLHLLLIYIQMLPLPLTI